MPVALANDGKADALISLYVSDDLNAAADSVEGISLQLLLNDPGAAGLPDGERLESVLVRKHVVPPRVGGPGPMPLWIQPPEKGIEKDVEVRTTTSRWARAGRKGVG